MTCASGGDTQSSGPVVWGGGIYTGVGLVSYRAGWPCSRWVVLSLKSSLGPVWYLCGSKPQLISRVCWKSELERAVLSKSGVFTKLRVVSRGLRRCGSVWRGILFWSTVVGPAWCSLVSMAFGECSLEHFILEGKLDRSLRNVGAN